MKIRIALAITEKGDWNVCGWGNILRNEVQDAEELMSLAIDPLSDYSHEIWLEADVEIPKPKTVPTSIVE